MNGEERRLQADLESKAKTAADKAFRACVALLDSSKDSQAEMHAKNERAGARLRRATKALSDGPAMAEALATMSRIRREERQ